jgi:K+/H+ antiporter YhaU regulatory subunit KhtT
LGKSIKETAVRTKTGASIVGMIHKQEFLSNPKADTVFQAEDMVAVVGNYQEREAFKSLSRVPISQAV